MPRRRGRRSRRTEWGGNTGTFSTPLNAAASIELWSIDDNSWAPNVTVLDQLLDIWAMGPTSPEASAEDDYSAQLFYGLACVEEANVGMDPETELDDEHWILTGMVWSLRPAMLGGSTIAAGVGAPTIGGTPGYYEVVRERAKAKRRMEDPCELRLFVKGSSTSGGSYDPSNIFFRWRWRGLFAY